MCKRKGVIGLRIFLFGLLSLIKEGEYEVYDDINNQISKGVASYLYLKYQNAFDKISFNPNNLEEIDDYYKTALGIADGNEGKYQCDKNDGLYLLLKIALNQIF